MANQNFVVHNGLSVGPTTIDAASGNVTIPVGKMITIGNVLIRDNGNGQLYFRDITDNSDAVINATLDSGSQTLGNIQIGTNHIESINANGPISLRPNGTGNISITANTIMVGKGGAVTIIGTGIQTDPAYGINYLPSNLLIQTSGASSSGNVRIDITTAATSVATGAFQVMGGAGIIGNAVIGGLVILTNAINNSGTNAASGALQVTGGAGIGGNLYVGGNLFVAGNTTIINTTINSQQTGNLTVGIPLNFSAPYANITFAGTQNNYLQMIAQNQNAGSAASVDYVAVANNGSDTAFFIDMGLNGSGYSQASPFNASYARDGYLYVQGDGTGVGGGNLMLSTMHNANKIFLAVGGQDTTNIIANVNAGGVLVTGYVNATGNILSTGAVHNSLTVNGNETVTGFLNVTGNILSTGAVHNSLTVNGTTTSQIVQPDGDNTRTLGTLSARWSTVYGVTFSGTSTTANYADLAEKYQADAEYAPGTVLMFGGDKEVTLAEANTKAVAGIVSTNPAHLMNDQLTGTNTVALGLTGRLPCKVQGLVRKGNMMVSAGNGYARAEADPTMGSVIGKALQDHTGLEGVIEVVVGRL